MASGHVQRGQIAAAPRGPFAHAAVAHPDGPPGLARGHRSSPSGPWRAVLRWSVDPVAPNPPPESPGPGGRHGRQAFGEDEAIAV